MKINERYSEKNIAKQNFEYFKRKVKNNSRFSRICDVDSLLLRDLDLFFYNCYQAPTFMDGFGQNCMLLNEAEFFDGYCSNTTIDFEGKYHWYKKDAMLDWYRVVIVQYMHYHLIERCQKGITTTCTNPYETFYNYLLNDFVIHQIPRMIFDESKKRYVPYEQSKSFIADSELRLKDEILAIKKLVPPKDRYKYYR